MILADYLDGLRTCPDELVECNGIRIADFRRIPRLVRDFGVYDNVEAPINADRTKIADYLATKGFVATGRNNGGISSVDNGRVTLRLDSPPQSLGKAGQLTPLQQLIIEPYRSEIIFSPALPRGLGKDEKELVEVVRDLANAIITVGEWVLKENITSCFLWHEASPTRAVFHPRLF